MEKNGAFRKKLLATFRIEAAEHIAAISSGLIELEKSPPADRQTEIIETVFRESHSMKGAARTVNLTVIENICQHLEGVFSALKRGDISPDRELLDLLHRSVNVLEAHLSDGAPSEKTGISGLLAALDNAARGIRSEERAEAAGEKGTGDSAGRDEPQPPADSAPPLRRAAETMRISKQRLESILLRAEGLLFVKQMMAQRTAELREVSAEVEGMKKEWGRIRPSMRSVEDAARKGGENAQLKKLTVFLNAQGEAISRLYDSLSAIEKASGHDDMAIASMADSLLDDLKTVSMLPFSSLLEMMPKVVRDLAHDRGKEATLVIRGADIEIDRRILDEMREALIHLVRNCIDHGIERPEQRVAMKKPSSGTISIDVSHRDGRSFEIAISDDGAGVDTSKVRNSAVRLGLLSREEADGMEDARLLPLVFHSGVTTSPIITDISGQGLGLAIVREKVERLGGSVFCETAEGKGASFRIILPLSLATFRGVLVQVAGRSFIIPIAGIDRMTRVARDEIKTIENRETITVEGLTIPYVPLSAVLELPGVENRGAGADFVQAAVIRREKDRIAFGIDDILQEQEVLVKNLGRQLARVRNVAGATVLGTGQVVPVLNVSDLLKSAVRVSPVAEARASAEEKTADRRSVLVVEDSITARTLLKNILEAAGYEVQTAIDGMDAFTALKTGRFDIVVSDIEMPRMNGFDLTARIRADKRLAELPVVLVTALESREDREHGIDVGANAYIVKSSFDQSNLLEVIGRLI